MAPLTGDVKTRAGHTIALEAGPRLCASIRHDVRASLGHEQLQTVRCHGSHSKVVAEVPGLQRNTMQRLASMGAVEPGSLDDPQIRVSAWVELKSPPTSTEHAAESTRLII